MELHDNIRVWLDGCFDLVHFGHANVVRQAKSLGDYLVVGIHSDEEISKHKGPPVFTQEERSVLLSAIKWIDHVVTDAPYQTQLEVLEKYNCNFCVHGDDVTTMADGKDAYAVVKNANKYVEVKRTEGISTTYLLDRMLKAVKRAELKAPENCLDLLNETSEPASCAVSSYTSGEINYTPNALRIAEFMVPGRNSLESIRAPNSSDTILYVPGAFDLLHVGHVEFLKKCQQLGSYIIVGLHSDESAALDEGRIGPILSTQERLLPLLACRYVNNVVIDAPYVITDALLDFFKVDFVVMGFHTKQLDTPNDPMAVPKRRGIFRQIQSESNVTTRQVINRIIENQIAYEQRNRKKEEKERDYIPLPVKK